MKKTMQIGVVLVATLVYTTAAVAFEVDTVSLGLKVWANTWKETVEPAAGAAKKFDNGNEPMVGPSLNVSSKDWFSGITYLKALGDYESSDWFANGDKMKFERSDLEFLAGYQLHDRINDLKLGFFVEYKRSDAPASYTYPAAGFNDFNAGTWKLEGPGLGLFLEKPLDDWTLLHGNVSYLFLQEEFAFSSGGVSRFDAGGWALEVAVSRSFAKAMSATVGVKYQRFKGEKDNGDDVTVSFSGLTGGISYTF